MQTATVTPGLTASPQMLAERIGCLDTIRDGISEVLSGESSIASLKTVKNDLEVISALHEFKQSLLNDYSEAISPLMLISSILSGCLSAPQAISLASTILKQFGSIGNLLARTPDELRSVAAFNDDLIILIRGIRHLLTYTLREPLQERPLISNNEALHNYLRFTMAHDNVESLRVLFLTSTNHLIKDEVLSTGSVQGVSIQPRELVRRTLEMNATALFIVHNHPSGDATPSELDVDFTRFLFGLLKKINVTLWDHLIVGLTKCFSMREAGLI